jgi:hypothetical protein
VSCEKLKESFYVNLLDRNLPRFALRAELDAGLLKFDDSAEPSTLLFLEGFLSEHHLRWQ